MSCNMQAELGDGCYLEFGPKSKHKHTRPINPKYVMKYHHLTVSQSPSQSRVSSVLHANYLYQLFTPEKARYDPSLGDCGSNTVKREVKMAPL